MKLFYEGRPVHGRLSTGHAASSYGLPVLVLDDGTALGAGDIAACDAIEISPEELRWLISGKPALGGKPEARP
jgi:hypothetical protein